MTKKLSLFDQIGADSLRRVIEVFYERLFADVMIGFFFHGKDKKRLIEKEFELTARILGASIPLHWTTPTRGPQAAPDPWWALRATPHNPQRDTRQ